MNKNIVYWIDAAKADQAPALFGLDPLERLRRTLKRNGVDDADIVVSKGEAPLGQRLRHDREVRQRPHIVLDGAALTDPRLIAHLAGEARSVVALCGEGDESAAALRIEPHVTIPEDAVDTLTLARQLAETGIAQLQADEFQGFIGVLRRDLPFYVYHVPNDPAAVNAREKWMFLANYKGSTDILTKWVFPPLVWPITRACAARGIHPNSVTAVSILLTIAVIPLFASGHLAAGLIAAYAMAVLDSVDGKLARLTLSDSAIGNILDHGLDIVHPPLWYLAWAYGLVTLGEGDWVIAAAWWMTGFYIADRLILMVAKARFKRGLHAMTKLDATVRTIISRRNTNLILLTLGLLTGANGPAFLTVVIWQGATALWHGVRTILLYPKGAP